MEGRKEGGREEEKRKDPEILNHHLKEKYLLIKNTVMIPQICHVLIP